MAALLELRHSRLALVIARYRRLPADNAGGMESLRDGTIGIGYGVAPAGIMLPTHRLAGQVLPGYPVEIIDINVDIVAIVLITVTVMPVIIVMMIVVVMVVMVVVVPVYAAEQGIGGGDAQTITKTFNKTIGKLLPRRGR